MNHPTLPLLAIVVALFLVSYCARPSRAQEPPDTRPSSETYRRLAGEIDQHLRTHVLQPWFSRAVDQEHGGFHSHFGPDWSKRPSQGKFIVFQARLPWVAAEVAKRRPDLRDEYTAYAKHGLDFLDTVMWDQEHGGFYWQLDDNGQLTPEIGGEKHLYGQVFGIYAAANIYAATGDPRALDLAQRGFRWLEEHAHDDEHGGYYEAYNRDGSHVRPSDNPVNPGMSAVGGFPLGYKSSNAHIHAMEALAELYKVWNDDLVRQRLEELVVIIRDRMGTKPGVLNVWTRPDFQAVTDHDSYGHDIETAFLLHEAEDALGRHQAKTHEMNRLFVDHTIEWGWDEERGGVYNRGLVFGEAWDKNKDWWSQFESLNSLLLMHEQHGSETETYWIHFLQQWRMIQEDLTDHENTGHFSAVKADGTIDALKGQNWKANYHEARALLQVSDRLRRMADDASR